ncbi:MAG: hypothetical protein Q8P22_11810 [Chloroflexota bacterium]|nr:hypothetical protein [Chloroflexota bacterium]
MRWYEVPPDTMARIIERRKRGDSYVSIGRDEKLDRRAVARIVREHGEHQSVAAAARSAELLGLFRIHVEEMRKAAEALLELAASPSVRRRLLPVDARIETLLHAKLSAQFRAQPVLVPYPEGSPEDKAQESELELRQAVAERQATRRARAVVEGLRSHVPDLAARVKGWNQAAASYSNAWQQLVEYARSKDVPSAYLEAAAKHAIGWTTGDWWVDMHDQIEEKAKVCVRVLLQEPGWKQRARGLGQWLVEFDGAYEKLEELLTPPRLDKMLITEHCQFCPVP